MSHTGEGVFNLGTGHGYSVLDMVHAFEEANGVKVPYEVTARRPGDLATCYADPAKSLEVLGWRRKRISSICAATRGTGRNRTPTDTIREENEKCCI